MKYLQYKFAIALVLFLTNSYSQTVKIDEFKSDTLFEFGDTHLKITSEQISAGFLIEILNSVGIDKIQQENEVPKFIDLNSDTANTTGKLYKSIIGMKPKNGKLLIKLLKGKEERTLTLIAETVTVETNKQTKSTTDCNPLKDYDNKFGEEARYFDNSKIVYVYDFNKDPSFKELYRITKKSKRELKKLSQAERAGNKGLNIQLVNFNKETLTSGKNIKFKIYNVNKFMYDVSIADSVIHFDSEPSPLFTRFFLGDSTLLGSLMGAFSEKISLQSNSDDVNKLMKSIQDFTNDYYSLKSDIRDVYNSCHVWKCCNSEYNDLVKNLGKIKAESANVQEELNRAMIAKTDCNSKTRAKIVLDNQIKDLSFKILKLNLSISELESLTTSLNTYIEKNQTEIKTMEVQVVYLKDQEKQAREIQLATLKVELTAKENKLNLNNTKLLSLKENRDRLEILYDSLKNSKEEVNFDLNKVCDSTILNRIEALEISNNLLKILPPIEELEKLIIFYNNMGVQNNSYTVDYISLNGNMLDLTISIATKDSILKVKSAEPIPQYYRTTPIQIPIIGKTFVSFSSGSFIALGKNLQNKTYAWQETLGNNNTVVDSSYTLVESGYTLPPMGFCALGNLEWKVTRSFGLGGSAGVGLSIEKSPRLAYLGGLSMFFGDLRQFTITGGFVGMQVNQITKNYQTVADNQVIYTSKPNVEYYKEFKVGGFISFTYTPFKIYKTKTVKSQNK